MKLPDVVGFAAILSAGYYWGSKGANATGTDWLLIGALLALGFYFAVILS